MLLRRILFTILGIFSFVLLLACLYFSNQELGIYLAKGLNYPPGSKISGFPVGGLNKKLAHRLLSEALLQPVELRYGEARIVLEPAQAGLTLDIEKMPPLPAEETGYWEGFWDHMMGRPLAPFETTLQPEYSPEQVRAFLMEEVVPRYDQPPIPALPDPGALRFQPGRSGTRLDVEAALPLIEEALFSRTNRSVDLPVETLPPGEPAWENLEILLRQAVAASGFDGILDLYLVDLGQNREVRFATWNGRELSTEPDIAFTASSIIKIPILISVYRRLDEPPGPTVDNLIRLMFSRSSNDAADSLMRLALDEVRGPLIVSEDMQALGLQNTFLAGYFSLGSPLLQIFETPANRRADVDTDPDMYNQTTPGEIGALLVDMYRCAEGDPARLLEVFPGEITREECRAMIEYLKEDREPYLIKAGLPDGTPIGHKHGYGSANQTILTIGDAGLVFTPGGDFMLAVFTHHPQLLLFDEANGLIVQLTRVIYNYYNFDGPQ